MERMGGLDRRGTEELDTEGDETLLTAAGDVENITGDEVEGTEETVLVEVSQTVEELDTGNINGLETTTEDTLQMVGSEEVLGVTGADEVTGSGELVTLHSECIDSVSDKLSRSSERLVIADATVFLAWACIALMEVCCS